MTGFPFGLPPSRPPPPKKKRRLAVVNPTSGASGRPPYKHTHVPFSCWIVFVFEGRRGELEKKRKIRVALVFFFLPILLLAVEIWLVVVATPPPDVKRPTRAGVFFTRRLSPSLPIGQVATVCVCVSTRTSLPKFTRVGSFSPVVFQLQWVS